MKKNKAYRYRIYSDKTQEELFQKTFGCARFIWNRMLADIKDHYEKEKKMIFPTPAEYKKEYEWLKEVKDSFALFDISYHPGELKAVDSFNRPFTLRSGDPASKKIVWDDVMYGDSVFSRISLQDENDSLIFADGKEISCEREGMEIIAAASEKTPHHHGFHNNRIALYGQGGFAVYQMKPHSGKNMDGQKKL